MNGQALGIIETVGLVPAVEAGDVALKTADITLVGSQAVGGGLVSILVKGDVAAVKASIDAAKSAAERLGEVRSVTVIARTAEGLDEILIEEGKRPKLKSEPEAASDSEPEDAPDPVVKTEALSNASPVKEVAAPAQETPEADSDSPEAREGQVLSFEMDELKKFKVTKLRRVARQLPTFPIARGEIKYAKKSDLLEAFAKYMKTLEK